MTCKEKIISNQFQDIIFEFEYTSEMAEKYSGDADACYQNVQDGLGVVYADREKLSEATQYASAYRIMPRCYGLMVDTNELPSAVPTGTDYNSLILVNTGILQVQGPPLSLTGRGVIIGFIDTGIRYTEDVFKRADGSSRILAIWDQTIQDGIPPDGFMYGTEYKNEIINEALNKENPLDLVPSTDENGHGTAMASVAAGSRLGNGQIFLGAAPDADIVVIKLKGAKDYLREYNFIPEGTPAFQENDIIFGIKYLDTFAQKLERPVVMCLGLGTNVGAHAGTSKLSRYFYSVLQRRNRAGIICAGNEGDKGHHYEGVINLSADNNSDEIEIRVGEGTKGFILQLWGDVPYVFTVSVHSPGGEVVPDASFNFGNSLTYQFVYEKTTLTLDYLLVEESAGQELINMRFDAPTPGIWTIRVTERSAPSGLATFRMWLPIEEFSSGRTYFIRPTPYITLTDPSTVIPAITVSFYDDANNSFATESSRGYTAKGDIKPDIAAPGVNVPTIIGQKTGSSMAAAITAGASAQFMQWAVVEGHDILLDSQGLSTYLSRGATRDSGVLYPNREWGYGRLSIRGAFDSLTGI